MFIEANPLAFLKTKHNLFTTNVETNEHFIGCIECWFISNLHLRQAFKAVQAI